MTYFFLNQCRIIQSVPVSWEDFSSAGGQSLQWQPAKSPEMHTDSFQSPLPVESGTEPWYHRGDRDFFRDDQVVPIQRSCAPTNGLSGYQGAERHFGGCNYRHVIPDQGHDREGGLLSWSCHSGALYNNWCKWIRNWCTYAKPVLLEEY